MARIDAVESLIEFINETKPYRTKLLDVTVEYVHNDYVNVDITESWKIEINQIFKIMDEANPEGYGMTLWGMLNQNASPYSSTNVPLNPLYDNESPFYVPELDRNNPLFDPEFRNSTPFPTQDQLDASLVYVEFVENYIESNWDNELNLNSSINPAEVSISFIDELDIVETRLCNYNRDFFLPYDKIQAFEYQSETESTILYPYSTAYQNQVPVLPDTSPAPVYDYVVAAVNFCVNAADPFACDNSPPPSPLPPWKPYVDFYVNNINVDPDEFSVGIIPAETNRVNLPYSTPNNNNQLVGYYPNSYGFTASGNGLNYSEVNNPIAFSGGYSSGTAVRVELDFSTNVVNFYTGTVPVLRGTLPITDTELTYCFAISMKNTQMGSEVSLVTLRIPPS